MQNSVISNKLIQLVKAYKLNLWAFFLLLLLQNKSWATDNSIFIADLIKQSESQNLENDSYWHALIHYKPSFFNSSAFIKSEVHDSKFFLAPDGKTNPQSELAATIKSFFNDATSNPNEHPQCKFVARFQWLQKKLNWKNINIKQQNCPQYKEWSFNGKIHSISLIFATGYLGSPASYFGHPLLKFNLSREKNPTDLLDTTLNYGAITPENENPFVYAMKGLFGGYDAGFTHLHFFYNNHNYSEVELRDMWEYELNLSPEQVQQIVSHTWELVGNRFSYLFLWDNCASRMAQLLESVFEQPLLPQNVPYAIPYTVFDSLAYKKKKDGSPLILKYSRIASRQTRFNEKYFSLKPEQQDDIHAVVSSFDFFKSEKYLRMSTDKKLQLLESLFDYYSFRIVKENAPEDLKVKKNMLLIERAKLPAKVLTWPEAKPKPPHVGQLPVLTRYSLLHGDKLKTAFEFRIRPAYYDFLSLDIGRLPNSSLAVFDLTLTTTGNELWIKELNIISLDTLNPSLTGLPSDGGYAWSFKLGLENLNLECKACTVGRIDGGFGKAVEMNNAFVIYGMLNFRFQSSILDSGNLAYTPLIGSLIKFSDYWQTHFIIGQRNYIDGTKSTTPLFTFENRFGNSRYWDVRLAYEDYADKQAKISYSYYY